MNKRLIHVVPLSLALISGAVHARQDSGLWQEFLRAKDAGVTTHVLEIDNDSLLLRRDDGFYTSGLRYAQRWALADGPGLKVYGWRIGQELYTASDIKLPPARVGPPDHPYAGWLYAGLFRESHGADGSAARIGIDVGCIGPCAGGEVTQRNLHRLLNQPLPQGWSRQVRNEFGVVLHGELTPMRWRPTSSFDMAPVFKVRFGNIFTDASAGFTARAGRLNPLPGQPTLHAFVRAESRLVGYNATLQGGYFSDNDPHVVAPRRLVPEAEIGIAWQSGPFGLSAGVVRRGNEVRDLPNAIGSQNYARFLFSYTPK